MDAAGFRQAYVKGRDGCRGGEFEEGEGVVSQFVAGTGGENAKGSCWHVGMDEADFAGMAGPVTHIDPLGKTEQLSTKGAAVGGR